MAKNKATVIRQKAGIDISKSTLDVTFAELLDTQQIRIKATRKFKNTLKGYELLLKWILKQCKGQSVDLSFVMEATGVYYEELAHFLYNHGHVVHVELPNKVKAYAKSWNQKSKTDKIDATLLAKLGLERKLRAWKPMSSQMLRLKRLSRERVTLLEEKTRLSNRLHAHEHAYKSEKSTISRLKQQFKLVEKQLKAVEENLQTIAKKDVELYKKIEQICTIKGVSFLTVVTILAETNGFELITSRAQLISYCGYDVVHNESGSSVRGKTRISKKGNRFVRRALYFPAISAVKYEPIFKNLYERVFERTRIKMKAYVAVQRKLLTIIFALFKNDVSFDPNYCNDNIVQKSRQENTPAYAG
jgi:transposase